MTVKYFIFVFALCFGLQAHAQWMVYDVKITPDEEASVNFHPYTGVYLIAPVEGGPTSMVFTTETAGRVYAVSRDAGRYFIAANEVKRRAVFSSTLIDGTVQAMYQASGVLSSTLSYRVNGQHRAARIPLTMSGAFMATDSEIMLQVPESLDIGVTGQAKLSATFRQDLTSLLHAEKDTSLTKAVNVIADLLEKYGYQPDVEPLPKAEDVVEVVPERQPKVIEPVIEDTSAPQQPSPLQSILQSTLFPTTYNEDAQRATR